MSVMTSPFPGMNPYLEDPAFWPDFHHVFLDDWCEAVAELLPEPYEARLDGRINLVPMSPEVIKLIHPDTSVSQGKHEFLEEVRETRIEIVHRPERSLIAVLELLSPTNKTGDGFQEYRAKRKTLLLQKVHLVELDLLVGGQRLPLARPLPAADYYAFVSRSEQRPNCAVYAWSVRQPPAR